MMDTLLQFGTKDGLKFSSGVLIQLIISLGIICTDPDQIWVRIS